MLDVLPLELLALGVVCPSKAFVQIESPVEGPGHQDEAPTDHLQKQSTNEQTLKVSG